jgi:hypothetical protein
MALSSYCESQDFALWMQCYYPTAEHLLAVRVDLPAPRECQHAIISDVPLHSGLRQPGEFLSEVCL